MKKKIYLISYILFAIVLFSEDQIILDKIRLDEKGKTIKVLIEADKAGRVIRETETDEDEEKIKYEYVEFDRNNKALKAEIYDSTDNYIGEFKFKYDEKGKLLNAVQKNKSGEEVYLSEFSEDEKGRIEMIRNNNGEIKKVLIYDENKLIDITGAYITRNLEDLLTYEKVLNLEKKRVLCFSNLRLSNKDVKRKDTILAELITDSIKEFSDAEIVLINGGSIKNGILKGKIQYNDLLMLFDNDDYLYYVNLTGKDLLIMMSEVVSLNENDEEYLNLAGMKIWQEGKKIHKIQINGKNLELKQEYKVAVNKYIAQKNGVFSSIKRSPEKTKVKISVILARYLSILKSLDSSYQLEIRNIKE